MPQTIQPSFGKGEIAPSLYGRVDTEMYKSALKTARNVLIHTHGGASSRGGLRYRAPCASMSKASRLIPFLFNTTDKYILEFGDSIMRVIRDGAHVTTLPTAITTVTKALPGVVTSVAHGLVDGQEVYISGVVGMVELNGNRYIVANKTADTFELTSVFDGTNVDTTFFTTYSSAGTVAQIFQIVSPYPLADLAKLKYVQSADVMTLTHISYSIRELSRTAHDAWTFTIPTFAPKTNYPTSVAVTTGAVGNYRARYKVTAVGDDESLPGLATSTQKTITNTTAANPVVVTATAHGFLTDDEVEISGLTSGPTELNGRRFIIDKLTADTFSLRNENGTGYAAYSASGGIVTLTFGEVVLLNISAITKANPAVVTVTVGHGIQTGVIVKIAGVVGMTQVNDRSFTTGTVTTTTIGLAQVDSTTFSTYTSGGSLWQENTARNVITWAAVAGASSYRIYKEKNGRYGFVGSTDALTFTEDNILPDTLDGPPSLRDPFFGTGNKPQAVGFFEQRRLFGGTLNSPDTSFYSVVGAPKNFSVHTPVQDDDAITISLTSQQVNEIRHFVPLQDLVILTTGGEWRATSGPDSAFTPTGVKQKPQTYFGCSHLRPLITGDTILFVEESNANVRSLGYSFQTDSFTGANVGLLAPHMLYTNTLVDWAYQGNPDNRIYGVRDDGVGISITYDEEQNVTAWTTLDTEGFFKSVATLRRGANEHHDLVYFVVKRKINGTTRHYIEQLDQTSFVEVQDCFFVDSGLTYDAPLAISNVAVGGGGVVTVTSTAHGLANADMVDITDIEWVPIVDEFTNETQPNQLNGGRFTVANKTTNTFEVSGINGTGWLAYVQNGKVRKAVSTISGLGHLSAQQIVALSDGNAISGLSVDDGVVTLPQPATRVHLGMPYVADLETLDIEAAGPGGTLQGFLKKVNFVVVKFERTRGLLIGPDFDHLVEMKQRSDEAYGEPTRLLTGNTAPIYLVSAWNSNGRIALRQRYPLPFTVLAIIPNFDVGTRDDNS